MQRNFLEKFLNKLSDFPDWVKEIIFMKLSKEVSSHNDLSYIFSMYKPSITDKGKYVLDSKVFFYDSNMRNILEFCDKNLSISEITLNTYLSLEEVARYFLLGIDEGYIETPQNSQISSTAGFLAGKYRTGEYFLKNGIITKQQLSDAIINYEHNSNKNRKKFGQFLVEKGLIQQNQLDYIISIKNESQKRFILDYNDVPKIKEIKNNYEYQIAQLRQENLSLKQRVEELSGGKK